MLLYVDWWKQSLIFTSDHFLLKSKNYLINDLFMSNPQFLPQMPLLIKSKYSSYLVGLIAVPNKLKTQLNYSTNFSVPYYTINTLKQSSKQCFLVIHHNITNKFHNMRV